MNNLYNFFRQVIVVTLLLIMPYFSCAQEKIINPANSQSEFESSIYLQSITTEQNTRIRKFKTSLSDLLPETINNQVLSAHPTSAAENTMFSLTILPRNQVVEITNENIILSSTAIICNDRPFGIADEYAIEEGQELMVAAPGLLANDIDPNGDDIIVSSITAPSHGTITAAVTSGSFTYVPDEGFTGTDQFQYILRDVEMNFSDPVTVTILVLEPFNRKPTGVGDHYGTPAGTDLVVEAPGLLTNDIDPDGDDIILSSITAPSHGTITTAVTSGSFTYVPDEGFTGTDQFEYILRDVEMNFSDPVTVTIQVLEPFNRKPLGVSDNYATLAGTDLVVEAPGLLANDIDPDGDDIILSSITAPSHGTITSAVTSGSFTYVPDEGFTGTDQFQYILRDAEMNFSDPVTVTVEVVGAGEQLIGVGDCYAIEANQDLIVEAPGLLANDFDPDGDDIILSSITAPSHGTITAAVTSGSFTYVPDEGFTGTDQFQYILRDMEMNFSDPVTVTIQVLEPFNRKPVGIEDEYAIPAGMSLIVDAPGLLTNDIDPDGDDIILSSITAPSHGTITAAVTSGSFTYVPDEGFTGTDQFQYILRDVEMNFSNPVTVTIQVLEPFNRKPLGVNDNYATLAGTDLAVEAPGLLANDLDPDGDDIILSSITAPSHGTITAAVTSGSFMYVPDEGFTGTDQFQYILRDVEMNFSDPVTVTIEVFNINQPPVASAADITIECEGLYGTIVSLDGSASTDPEDNIQQYTWYENGSIIAGPSAFPTSEVTLSTGVHAVTLMVEDECGNTSSDDATVTIEDTSSPFVETEFLPTNHPHEFEISFSSEDVCSEIISSISVILIPELINPSVSLKNNKNYSLMIDTEKNTVSVKAPDAAAFWAMIMANGGVEVSDGQIISAKDDKNKYKYSFDSQGKLVSVAGEIITLRCTATDENGNTGMSEATLPTDLLKSLETLAVNFNDKEIVGWHRNYPNPFNHITTIEYRLEKSSFVNIYVYDHLGRLVDQLESTQLPKGIHQITWDASKHNPGIYFYRIECLGNLFTGKMLYNQQ
ncbi:MAG TPA: Ig-like domain-containing protein [Bacteroidales bacterium]